MNLILENLHNLEAQRSRENSRGSAGQISRTDSDGEENRRNRLPAQTGVGSSSSSKKARGATPTKRDYIAHADREKEPVSGDLLSSSVLRLLQAELGHKVELVQSVLSLLRMCSLYSDHVR